MEEDLGQQALAYSPACDASVAVPAFSAANRARASAMLLHREANAAAMRWNQSRHPRVSGVDPEHIRTDLARYVDLEAVARRIRDHNHAHPLTPIDEGTPPIDAVFVQAVHQFQASVFLESSQADGLAGESTLASLGITGFRGTRMNTVARANPGALKRLRKIRVSAATGGEYRAADWFEGMVNPGFLGWRFRKGVHLLLVRRLRTAEAWLLSLPEFRGMTPVELGRALGFDEQREEHKGARPFSASSSMHTYGLALDVRYTANPWVRGAAFTAALKRAALLISGVKITQQTAAAFFGGLGSDPSLSTREIFRILARRNEDFRAYLALHDDPAPLPALLEARVADGTFEKAASLRRWRWLVWRDVRRMRATDSPFRGGSGLRDPRKGFLDLPEELVVALRDKACLAWGAVDFGPGASGDVMHFDARVCGIGARLAVAGGNYRVDRGHPCTPCRPPG